jgi:hypothetical protein
MLTKDEADRIANAITGLRPDWNHAQLMAVLGDRRLREQRTYRDATLAFVALALDATTRQPTRIYEHGPWWELLAPRVGSSVQYKTITDADCAICSRPELEHPLLNDDHTWEPQHARIESHVPTPEQRAALDKAAAEARAKVTAAKEAAEKEREVASVDDVLARHQSSKDDNEYTTSEGVSA